MHSVKIYYKSLQNTDMSPSAVCHFFTEEKRLRKSVRQGAFIVTKPIRTVCFISPFAED